MHLLLRLALTVVGAISEFGRRQTALHRALFARQTAENAAHQGIADLARNG